VNRAARNHRPGRAAPPVLFLTSVESQTLISRHVLVQGAKGPCQPNSWKKLERAAHFGFRTGIDYWSPSAR
jgi:hypothetical protein